MNNIDVVILCGGVGKRLRSVVYDRPKPMAEVNDRPFLDLLIQYAADFGFKRFILCTGYLGEIIRNHYDGKIRSLDIVFSQEDEPLGTGGAIKNAKTLIQSDPFLVMNGDSFCRTNFYDFVEFHRMKKAVVSILLSMLKDDQNSGKVTLDEDSRIIEFNEKADFKEKCYCNSGVYLMEREIFQFMENYKTFSLEYDLFPVLVKKNCYGYYGGEDFLDIGTPQNLMKVEFFLKNILLNKKNS